MEIKSILDDLEQSWSREKVFLEIQRGKRSEKIINEFLKRNQNKIEELASYLIKDEKNLLNQLEELSVCEANLIKRINNLSIVKDENISKNKNKKKFLLSENIQSFKFGLFMIKWSNKFVVTSLLIMSAIALSKQAWT